MLISCLTNNYFQI